MTKNLTIQLFACCNDCCGGNNGCGNHSCGVRTVYTLTGITGPTGATGPRGPRGYDGADGAVGATGATEQVS